MKAWVHALSELRLNAVEDVVGVPLAAEAEAEAGAAGDAAAAGAEFETGSSGMASRFGVESRSDLVCEGVSSDSVG